MKKKHPLLYLLIVTLFSIHSAFMEAKENKKKSVKDFLSTYRKNNPEKKLNFDLIKRSNLLSTIIPNIGNLSENSLRKKGFYQTFILNEDDFISEAWYKKSNYKKPLLVFLAGFTSSAKTSSFINFADKCMTEDDSHCLLLENSTSGEWIKRNSFMLGSGIEAGWNIYLSLKKFRESHKDTIEKIHVIGLSLGGNDAVFAAYIDSILKTNIIDGSVLAFSSPADRINGFIELKEKDRINKIIIDRLLQPAYKSLAFLGFSKKRANWLENSRHGTNLVDHIIIPSSQHYLNHRSLIFERKVLKQTIVQQLNEKETQVEALSQLYKLSPHVIKITKPILWVHSEDDPIVSFSLTYNCLLQIKNDNFMLLSRRYGGHLGYPFSYGKKWVHQLIDSYTSYWK